MFLKEDIQVSLIEFISAEQLVNFEGFLDDFHPIVQDFGSIFKCSANLVQSCYLRGVIGSFLMFGCFLVES